jgi:hypothetical protein
LQQTGRGGPWANKVWAVARITPTMVRNFILLLFKGFYIWSHALYITKKKKKKKERVLLVRRADMHCTKKKKKERKKRYARRESTPSRILHDSSLQRHMGNRFKGCFFFFFARYTQGISRL